MQIVNENGLHLLEANMGALSMKLRVVSALLAIVMRADRSVGDVAGEEAGETEGVESAGDELGAVTGAVVGVAIGVAAVGAVVGVVIVHECTCDIESMDSSRNSESLKYKVGSIAAILVAGALGVGLPLLGKRIPALRPENDKFFVVKAFAAGVILSTGFVHILPDAFENLNSPCLDPHPWGDFPFTGFIAMVSAIATLMIESLATGYYQRLHFKKSRNAELVDPVNESTTAITVVTVDAITVTVDTHGTGGHADGAFHAHGHHHHDGGEGSGVSNSSVSEIIRQRIVSQVLEIGIVVHSVIIGMSLGASQSADTIKPLMAALCFHQFFEGIGLGGCISQLLKYYDLSK
ncbi:hypothetical protein ACFE04_027229 [Oxalis oulophora]